MNIRAKLITCVLAALALALGAQSAVAADGAQARKTKSGQKVAKIGEPAPGFTLKDINGKEHTLSALKGQIVVLEWINHECPVVNRCHDTGEMKSTLKVFKRRPVKWLAIDSSRFCEEKIESIRSWAEEKKIQYPYLLDASGKVGRAYGAKTTPHMFVIDSHGNLAYSGALDNNPDGKVETKRNYVWQAVVGLVKNSKAKQSRTKPYGCFIKYKK